MKNFINAQTLSNERTDFVERQPEYEDLVSDRDDNLNAKLTASQSSRNLSELVPTASVDVIGDQHRCAIFESPERTLMR